MVDNFRDVEPSIVVFKKPILCTQLAALVQKICSLSAEGYYIERVGQGRLSFGQGSPYPDEQLRLTPVEENVTDFGYNDTYGQIAVRAYFWPGILNYESMPSDMLARERVEAFAATLTAAYQTALQVGFPVYNSR